MNKIMILALGLLTLALPAVCSATHVVSVVGDANCNGWSLCTTVQFANENEEHSLAYTVTILDGNGDEVTSFGETQIISSEPGPGTDEYCFDGIWEGVYQVSQATVVITSAMDGQNPTTFNFSLDCAVADETTSLDSLKAQYR